MNLRHDLLPLLKETYSKFQADQASMLGAALAYYALFSLFPLLLLLIAGLGYVLQYWDQAVNAQDAILAAVSRNFSPQLSDALNQILGGIKNNAAGDSDWSGHVMDRRIERIPTARSELQ